MLSTAASCRVRSLAKLARSLSYSARARATQRSMTADLLMRTSSTMDSAIMVDVSDERSTRLIESGLFAQYEGLIDSRLRVPLPKATAFHNDLILHHGR